MKGGVESPFQQMYWFIGVVEAADDPDEIGRVRVRCIKYHTEDKDAMPTESLPWAHTLQTQYGTGIGWSPVDIVPGTWVCGWFVDGEIAQQPVIWGVLPSMPSSEGKQPTTKGFSDPTGTYPRYYDEADTSRVARGVKDGTAYASEKGSTNGDIGEPASPWAPKWPHNRVLETKAGHLLEYDDTPGKERVHIYHKSGSFIEFHPDGSLVARTKGSQYNIVFGDDKIHVSGSSTLIVNGDCTQEIKGNLSAKVGGDASIEVGGSATLKANEINVKGGTIKLDGSSIDIKGSGVTIDGGSSVTIKGSTITFVGTVVGDNT